MVEMQGFMAIITRKKANKKDLQHILPVSP